MITPLINEAGGSIWLGTPWSGHVAITSRWSVNYLDRQVLLKRDYRL
jgi:hypothetical protein